MLPDLDGDPDTVDILVFDNGNDRFDNDLELQLTIAANEAVAPEFYSRVVHYQINEKEKTVEQIWQFGAELGETYYSSRRGDANLLKNGDTLGTFDRYFTQYGGDFDANFIEVDPEGNIVWEAYATSTSKTGAYAVYRCERLSLYTSAANDLQIGAPALNLIPEDMLP